MKGLDSWILAAGGVGLQKPVTEWLIEYSPYLSSLNQWVLDIATTIVAIIGVFMVYRSYQVKTRAVRGLDLDNSIKEKQLAEDKTDSIVDRVLKKIEENKSD